MTLVVIKLLWSADEVQIKLKLSGDEGQTKLELEGMLWLMSKRPSSQEYNAYYEQYVRLVPEGDISDILAESLKSTTEFLSDIPQDKWNSRYAEGKWSLKQVLGHVNDGERIMSYRLLRIARGDKTPLAGFDQDELMKGISFDDYALSELIEDYMHIRRSTLSLIRGLNEDAWERIGLVNDNDMSVRALAYIIAGHEIHHLNIIKERYLA